MGISAAISLGLAIAGFIGGLITAVAKLAIRTGRIMERLDANEARDNEERATHTANFSELYGRMAAVEGEVKSQKAEITNLLATCTRIESKLDRIIERSN